MFCSEILKYLKLTETMKRILLIWICAMSIYPVCFGQILPDTIFQMEFKYRVKQLDEFMARFNGEETIDVAVADSLKAQLNLLYLFNHELFVANRDSMKQQAETFIHTVVDHGTTLHFDDKDWFAEVLCNCTYKGHNEQVTLYLKPEKIEEFQYRWVIIGAKGKLLQLNPLKRNRGLDILPNNHEVAFMALPKIALLGSANILNYSAREYTSDQLTAFYALVYSEALKIETTGKIVYHFLEVPEYVFTVERFMRQGTNTGWLISRLLPMCETEKQTYFEQCLSN